MTAAVSFPQVDLRLRDVREAWHQLGHRGLPHFIVLTPQQRHTLLRDTFAMNEHHTIYQRAADAEHIYGMEILVPEEIRVGHRVDFGTSLLGEFIRPQNAEQAEQLFRSVRGADQRPNPARLTIQEAVAAMAPPTHTTHSGWDK